MKEQKAAELLTSPVQPGGKPGKPIWGGRPGGGIGGGIGGP